MLTSSFRFLRLPPVVLCLLFWGLFPVYAQDAVPTLPVPTPVPQTAVVNTAATLTESTLARISRDGRMRVGILFNEPPFGELSISGEVEGFDAALATLIADVWGVELDFVQVTRLNAVEMLQNAQVDMLLAAMIHQRDLDTDVQFTQSYRVGQQMMMVLADSALERSLGTTGRRVGYVAGTDTETALNAFTASTGISFQLQPYLTLDRGFVALFAGEIEVLAGRESHLLDIAAQHLDEIKLLDGAIQPESYGIAVHRDDTPMRQLLNQTLQALLLSGELEKLYDEYFPGEDMPCAALMLWNNAPQLPESSGDIPCDAFTLVTDTARPVSKPGEVSLVINAPATSIVERLRNGGALRVAGIPELAADASEVDRRINALNRVLVEKLAAQWGVDVQFVSGDAVQLLSSGQADLAAGIEADWLLADRLDFSVPYLLHGDRLMVETRDDISSFQDLGGRWIGIMATDSGAQERAQAWADSISRTVRFYSTFEQDAAEAMLEASNADVIYGDSLKLIAHLEANPGTLELTERWYSREYFVFALPANDPEFRLLVNYSLQELIKNAELNLLSRSLMPPNSELPDFEVWWGNYPGELPGF